MGHPSISRGTFVGRAADLDRLAATIGLRGTVAGSTAVLVAGDAGVGKTRLLSELAAEAAGAGWRVVVGHCLDFGDSAPSYLPFTEAFGRVAAESPALGASLVENQPALDRLMPGHRSIADGPTAPAARMDRAELFEAVYAGLNQLARGVPLLLVVEDVHWADHSTREMLSFLFARPFPEPVTIIASYRSDDLHRRHPLRAVVGEWGRLPGVTRLPLQPLADRDVRVLVRSLHPGPIPESGVSRIADRAEGNAFFVEELVAAVDMADRSLPTDLADLLLVRVDQLDEPVRVVVRAASVAGRRVTHQLLAWVSEVDDVTLDRSLRAAVEANVLVAVGAEAYAFRHALLAEAVYDDLLPGERVRLHAAYSRVLANHGEEGTAAELARRARAAHDVTTALRASIEAGNEAMAVAGPAEAADHYGRALELLGEAGVSVTDPPVGPVHLALLASDALIAAGNVFRALALLNDQLRHLPSDGPATDRAQLLHALAGAALQADTCFDALQATTEAVKLVPIEPASALRARVVNMHARANADRRRDDEAAMWAGVAIDLGRQLQLPDIVADATTTLARIDERAGDPESSRRALERVVLDARATGDVPGELRALFSLGALHYTLGQLTEAETACRTAVQRARDRGQPWTPYGLAARALAGIVAYTAGDWDQVSHLADVRDEAPPVMAEALLVSVGLAVAAGRGEREAIALADHVRPQWEHDGQIAICVATAAIDLYGDQGELAKAVAVYDDVVACIGGLWQMPLFEARMRLSGLMLGQLCAEARRSASAERLDLARRGDELAGAAQAAAQHLGRGWPQGIESAAWLARVTAEQCRLRWLTGVDAPGEHELVGAWRQAVEGFEHFGHRFETARSRARLADVLRATGRTEEGGIQASLARETAVHLGATPLLNELDTHAASAGSRRTERLRSGDALTAREREVLELLAVGRSNRDIGHQLYISAKTVSVHVSNLMAKLDARSRTEAVAVARRRDLLPDDGPT